HAWGGLPARAATCVGRLAGRTPRVVPGRHGLPPGWHCGGGRLPDGGWAPAGHRVGRVPGVCRAYDRWAKTLNEFWWVATVTRRRRARAVEGASAIFRGPGAKAR